MLLNTLTALTFCISSAYSSAIISKYDDLPTTTLGASTDIPGGIYEGLKYGGIRTRGDTGLLVRSRSSPNTIGFGQIEVVRGNGPKNITVAFSNSKFRSFSVEELYVGCYNIGNGK